MISVGQKPCRVLARGCILPCQAKIRQNARQGAKENVKILKEIYFTMSNKEMN
jgi:hypothetical protein